MIKKKKVSPAPGSYQEGVIDSKQALALLRSFYLECRREIKKYEQLPAAIHTEDSISGLYFAGDGFDLSLVVKEGGL